MDVNILNHFVLQKDQTGDFKQNVYMVQALNFSLQVQSYIVVK